MSARTTHWLVALLLGSSLAVFSQTSKFQTDRPSGFVLDGGDAQVSQPVIKTELPALPGVLLYEGDVLVTGKQSARIVLCPRAWQIQPESRVVIAGDNPTVLSGKSESAPPPSTCELPRAERFPLAETAAGTQADGSPGTRRIRLDALDEDARTQLLPRLSSVERAIAADPLDVSARIARANLFEFFHLPADARFEYDAIGKDFPGAAWTRGIGLRLDLESAAKSKEPGKTYALLIGISNYRDDTGIRSLFYAARDAITFRDFLQSKRGGGLPASQIDLMIDGGATREKIEAALNGFVRNSRGENNTLIVMIAAHGANVPSADDKAGEEDPQPYILTYDGNPQDLATAGIPMSKLRKAIAQQITSFRQVVVYLDVCHAGSLWPVKAEPKAISKEIRSQLKTKDGNLGIMLATSPNEEEPNTLAYESEMLDHGHGAFTYYVLSALNGGLTPTEQGKILFDDLAADVNRKVRDATSQKQRPFGQSSKPNLVVVENAHEEGIRIDPPSQLPIVPESTRGKKKPAASPAAVPIPESADAPFRAALQAGNLLPCDHATNAREILNVLRSRNAINEIEWRSLREQLRVALEEKGQDVILAYLRGAQPPLRREDFLRGRDYFRAALEILPGSSFDESRMDFADGRALLFEHDYKAAVALLQLSIRIDPTRAYAYNALGNAYLEQLTSDPSFAARAESAYRDAMRFAPYWAYPWHNLALLYAALGNYKGAFDALKEGVHRAPTYSYLPYTIGLLNQQLNRIDAAKESYQIALEKAQTMRDLGHDLRLPGRWPERAEILNALGTLTDNDGHSGSAERLYRKAILVDSKTVSARLNLAARLSENGKKSAEAEALWRAAIAEDAFAIGPHFELAEYLRQHGNASAAIPEYQAELRLDPHSSRVLLGLSKSLYETGKLEQAATTLEGGNSIDQDFESAELLGDVYAALRRDADARRVWRQALALYERAGDPRIRNEGRQRIADKLNKASGR